jgi:hypothetical protein
MIPDGATATHEEMVVAHRALVLYEKAITDYTFCLAKELDDAIAQAGYTLKPQQKADMQRVQAQKHNAAVDVLQAIAGRFNEQLRVFEARNGDNAATVR